MRILFRFVMAATFALALLLNAVSAQSTVWTNPNSGRWQDDDNWNNGVPRTDESAFFNLDESYFVFWDSQTGPRNIQSAQFNRGDVAIFNTDTDEQYLLTLTGAAGLPSLSVSSAATFHGVEVNNLQSGFLNSGGRLTISGDNDQRSSLINREFFRFDGTADVFGRRALLINTLDAGIGYGSLGAATTASVLVRDEAFFRTARDLYIGRDAAGATFKKGELNVESGALAIVGGANILRRNELSAFSVDDRIEDGGNLFVDNASAINVSGESAVGIVGSGFVELKGESTWNSSRRMLVGVGKRRSFSARGRIDVLSGSQVSALNTSLGGTFVEDGEFGEGTVNIDGAGSTWETGNLTVRSGSSLTIRNGGTMKATDQVRLGPAGEIQIQDGRLEFGLIFYEDLLQLQGTSGALAGRVSSGGQRDINDFGLLNDAAFITSEVEIRNSGLITGNGSLDVRVDNFFGTLESFTGNTLRFIGGASNGVNNNPSSSGRIRLAGGRIQLDAGLVNKTSGVVEGHGLLITGGIENSGMMDFSTGQMLVLGDVNNLDGGQIIADGSNTLSFRDAVIHNGEQFKVGEGATVIFESQVSGFSDFTGQGLHVFEDALSPGNSAGVISFEGDVELTSDSLLEIELGGLAIGQFDQLQIAGDLDIAGSLSVSTLGGLSLSGGQEFLIASVDGNLTGEFTGLSEGDLVGNFGSDLFISYQAGNGNDISLFTAVPEPNSISLLALLCAIALSRSRRRQVT